MRLGGNSETYVYTLCGLWPAIRICFLGFGALYILHRHIHALIRQQHSVMQYAQMFTLVMCLTRIRRVCGHRNATLIEL